jgi:hypothetical protein
VDALAIVAENSNCSRGLRHRTDLCQLLTVKTHSHGPYRSDINEPGFTPTLPYLFHHTSGISDRSGIGHGMDTGVAAKGRRLTARCDSFRILSTRLTQVGVKIDKPRKGDEPIGLDDVVTQRGTGRFNGFNAISHEDNIGWFCIE